MQQEGPHSVQRPRARGNAINIGPGRPAETVRDDWDPLPGPGPCWSLLACWKEWGVLLFESITYIILITLDG